MTMLKYLVVLTLIFLAGPILAADTTELDDRTRAVASELRCVVCQNLSVADSPSEMAQQMKGIIREQLQAGKTPAEIKDYFVSKYGEWVLLKPATTGFSLVLWVLPFIALAIGLGLGIWLLRRWATKRKSPKTESVDPALLARVRAEAGAERLADADPEPSAPQSALRQERARLYADLRELEFDFQAGKLSETDYGELRQEIESKAASVLQQIEASPENVPSKKKPQEKISAAKSGENKLGGLHGWQLAAGGVFLLLFGLALGVALTKSLRPRASEQDTVTGDFLTGTGSQTNSEVAASLKEGKDAFAKQDWTKAIDAFKKVLASDPNQPEAHAYMGFILIQAGHADGALIAFDKALAAAPNFPMALWGKGITLYQAKQDYAGAREAFEKLLQMMPPGQERGEVEKILAEIPQPSQKTPKNQQTAAGGTNTSEQISGKISIDPKLKGSVDSQAVLFIIARPAGSSGGPPLAVKRIERPVFPLSYSLGSENVMMQGMPFSGKVNISVRLDKDGNPTTRQPGDLTGETKTPAEVGAKNIDIVLDQIVK
jgi:cytochrome c-type biogenesis protein CcmH